MKKIVRMTESDLHDMVMESVKKILKEDEYSQQMENDRRYAEWIQEEKSECQALVDFLQRNGIQSVHVSQYPSGLPVVAMDTDEYYKSNANVLADKFLHGRNAYVSSQTYPATTYLRINKY